MNAIADPSDRAVLGVDMGPLLYYDCTFEPRRGNECLSVVNVVYGQIEISATR